MYKGLFDLMRSVYLFDLTILEDIMKSLCLHEEGACDIIYRIEKIFFDTI